MVQHLWAITSLLCVFSIAQAAGQTNLVSNPGFESGTGSWSFYTNGSGSFSSVSPGFTGSRAGRVTIATPGTNVQLYQSGIRLEANTSYTLRFSAYSTSGNDVSLHLHKQNSPFTNYGVSNEVLDLTSSWQTFTITFTTTGFSGNITDGRLRFWFVGYAAAGDLYFVDDVEIVKSTLAPVPPSIISHPGNQSVSAGMTATFQVSASGTVPLSFQWQKNGSNISGATGNSHTTPAAVQGDSGSTYRCVVTNSVGSTTSNNAILSVIPSPPVVVSHPSDQTVVNGSQATFSVSAGGTPPLAFQWQRDGVDIGSANGTSYTTPPAGTADDGALFQCIVSNAYGTSTSAPAQLRVAVSPSITIHPSGQNTPVGGTATFSLSATGTAPLQYQWQKNGVDISGATSASFSTPPVTSGDNGALYRCRVSNIAGSVTSNTATLTVTQPPPSLANLVQNGDFESGLSPWSFYTNGSGSFAVVSPGFSGSNSARLTIHSAASNIQFRQASIAVEANLGYTLTFRAYSTSGRDLQMFFHKDGSPYTSYGLGEYANLTTEWQTFTFTFTTSGFSGTVNDGRLRFWLAPYAAAGDQYFIDGVELRRSAVAPVITTHPVGQTIPDGQTASFSVVAAGTLPISYQWQKNGADIPGATSSSFTIPQSTQSDNGSIFRCVVTNPVGSSVSNGASLTVVPSPPVISTHPGNQVVLAGQSATFSVTAAGTQPLSYQWQKDGVNVSGANASSYSSEPANSSNNGSMFRCIVTNVHGADTSSPALLTIGVPPSITTHPSGLVVQDGAPASFAVAAGGTEPLTYQWQRNGANISSASNPTYAIGATTMADSGVTFRCIVSNPVGAETSQTALLIVNGVSPTIRTEPLPQTVTVGQSTTFQIVSSGSGTLFYQWQKNSVNIAGATAPSYTTPPAVAADNGALFRCIVRNYLGADTSENAGLTVTTGIAIQVWYGKQQRFGHIGNPVPYINILGNVSATRGMKTLSYSLNNTAYRNLNIGPDTRRLAAKGDFNIDIQYTTLANGSNQVVIKAVDSINTTLYDTVTVTYAAGNTWPATYATNWGSASVIGDAAQVVDGLWSLNPSAGTIRPLRLGYDRLIAVGETNWSDYEVTVPVTIHRFDSSGYAPPSNGGGVGFILRWIGHTDSPASTAGRQPRTGYLPLGGLLWYDYRQTGEKLIIIGNNLRTVAQDNSGRKLLFNVPYIFKARVETTPGVGGRYSLKVWQAGSSEPAGWDISGQESLTDPQQGCILLVAHHVDATFGNVSVVPLSGSTYTLSVGVNGNGTVQVNPNQTSFAAGQLVSLTANPGSGWQFQGWSGDLTGSANPATITMSTNKLVTATFTSGLPPSTIVSDNFNSPALNSSLWTFVNPRSDASISMTGSQASISVPGGTSHDVWTGGNFAPRIMQTANNTDFEIEAKFQSTMNARFQIQGLLAEQDASNYIRFDFVRDASTTRVFTATFAGGIPTVRKDSVVAVGNPLYLRVLRSGNQWVQQFGYNGTAWFTSTVFTHSLALNKVGVFFGNAGGPVPPFTGLIDYFFNTASPIVPTLAGVESPGETGAKLIPATFVLGHNYPNPFNPSTTVEFGLPEPAHVDLRIFDVVGREIGILASGDHLEGYHTSRWNGTTPGGYPAGSGVYFYRILAVGASGKVFSAQHKMMLVK